MKTEGKTPPDALRMQKIKKEKSFQKTLYREVTKFIGTSVVTFINNILYFSWLIINSI